MGAPKPITSSLKRVIGLTTSILLVSGIMIGTGIFQKIGPMAKDGLNSSYIIAAWLVAGIVTMMGALAISGLAELTTESGGEYEYLRIIFGKFPAFIFGWSSFTVIGSASVAAMSHLFIYSISGIFPFEFLNNPLNIKLLACVLICLLTVINILGTSVSASVNNFLTYIKIAGILVIIIGAFFIFKKEPSTAFSKNIPHEFSTPKFISVFFAAMLSAFWAYDGWLSLAFMTGEIKDPKNNVPKGIIRGIALVMILYILVNIAFMKVMPTTTLASLHSDEIAATKITALIFGNAGNFFISVLILISTLGSVNGIIITFTRMYYKMAVDGMFFKKAANVHPRYETPHMSLLYAMLISCALVFSGTFDTLTNMIVFAEFLFYAMLAIGLIMLKRKGIIKSKVFGYPLIPIVFIFFSLALLINTFYTDTIQTLFGVLLMASGIPFYYYFKRINL